MKNIGIICEFNPLHNGHQYLLNQAKEMAEGGTVVCLMSGNFVQRGEPALLDKWTRAEMAVRCGADVVLELPVCYSLQSAEFFSLGAVAILDGLDCIDYLLFGSECGDIEVLVKAALMLLEEDGPFKQRLRNALHAGCSYPRAFADAMETGPEVFPNNILAIEYCKAIHRLNSPILPKTLARTDNGSEGSGATAIRKWLREGRKLDKLNHSMPKPAYELLAQRNREGRLLFPDHFSTLMLYAIRSQTAEGLRKYISSVEGLENRIKKAAQSVGSLENLLTQIKTKRYTRAFLQRTLFQIFLGVDGKFQEEFKLLHLPRYARVLAFRPEGTTLLRQVTDHHKIPVINKTANFLPADEQTARSFALDLHATDIYALGYSSAVDRHTLSDFYHAPVYLK